MNDLRLRGASALLCVLFLAGPSATGAAAPPGSSGCTAEEYRQFDFWLGDWDAIEADGSNSAHVLVRSILDGCVLEEIYEGAAGAKGRSFTIFDASRNLWHQSWVTNRGRLLEIEGVYREPSIELRGADRTPAGEERLVRGTWQAIPGGVRETAATSMDHGKTWMPWFDIVFRPHELQKRRAAADKP